MLRDTVFGASQWLLTMANTSLIRLNCLYLPKLPSHSGQKNPVESSSLASCFIWSAAQKQFVDVGGWFITYDRGRPGPFYRMGHGVSHCFHVGTGAPPLPSLRIIIEGKWRYVMGISYSGWKKSCTILHQLMVYPCLSHGFAGFNHPFGREMTGRWCCGDQRPFACPARGGLAFTPILTPGPQIHLTSVRCRYV